MRVLVSIDDTDNLESIGTGELAEIIAQNIEKTGIGLRQRVTRHQLYVHQDIPYTSHNSSMCFSVTTTADQIHHIIECAQKILINQSAEGSDPGLCVVNCDLLAPNEACELITFGQSAKKEILQKEDAYQLAKKLNIHLSEHGGTGQGIIGALAGTGLRLSGNDGRFRGKLNIQVANNVISVRELCGYDEIDLVQSVDGKLVNEDDKVLLGEKIKTVFLENKAVLLVTPLLNSENVAWQCCNKQQLKRY